MKQLVVIIILIIWFNSASEGTFVANIRLHIVLATSALAKFESVWRGGKKIFRNSLLMKSILGGMLRYKAGS